LALPPSHPHTPWWCEQHPRFSSGTQLEALTPDETNAAIDSIKPAKTMRTMGSSSA